MTFVFTVGDLPAGSGHDPYGTADLKPFGSTDTKTGRVTAIDQSKSTVIITIDLAKIESNNRDRNNEEVFPQDVFNHEVGHGKDAMEDPIKYANAAKGLEGGEAGKLLEEANAEQFAKALNADGTDTSRYPDPESSERAEDDTRALFGLPRKQQQKPPNEEKKKPPEDEE